MRSHSRSKGVIIIPSHFPPGMRQSLSHAEAKRKIQDPAIENPAGAHAAYSWKVGGGEVSELFQPGGGGGSLDEDDPAGY